MTAPITLAVGQVWIPTPPSRAKARTIYRLYGTEVFCASGLTKSRILYVTFRAWIRRHNATVAPDLAAEIEAVGRLGASS